MGFYIGPLGRLLLREKKFLWQNSDPFYKCMLEWFASVNFYFRSNRMCPTRTYAFYPFPVNWWSFHISKFNFYWPWAVRWPPMLSPGLISPSLPGTAPDKIFVEGAIKRPQCYAFIQHQGLLFAGAARLTFHGCYSWEQFHTCGK